MITLFGLNTCDQRFFEKSKLFLIKPLEILRHESFLFFLRADFSYFLKRISYKKIPWNLKRFFVRVDFIRRNEWRFRREIYLSMRILFVYSSAGVIFFFKIVKMNLTNSRRKKSPHLFDQWKRKYISIFPFSANTFQSDQIEGGC